MPSKRRQSDNDSEKSDEYKSKRLRSGSIKETPDNLIDINTDSVYKEVVDYLLALKDDDGDRICGEFEKLPSRESMALYYEFIKQPIDFKMIKRKISNSQYTSLDDLEADILLLIKNVHTFNEPRSQISRDATALKKAYNVKRAELNKIAIKPSKHKAASRQTSEESIESKEEAESKDDENEEKEEKEPEEELKDEKVEENEEEKEEEEKIEEDEVKEEKLPSVATPQTPAPVKRQFSSGTPKLPPIPSATSKDDGLLEPTFEPNVFSVFYNDVATFTDHTGKRLAMPYLRLPHKRIFEDYYKIVKKPLSLCKIRTKIKNNGYRDLERLEQDFNLVFSNALLFFPPETYQHQDAIRLQAYMRVKKFEIESSGELVTPQRERKKPGRKPRVPVEGETPPKKRRRAKEGVAEEEPKSSAGRMKTLYNCVIECKDAEGRSLHDMFLHLPDKEEYPEYLKIIPQPIDLTTINKKLTSNEYTNEDEFISDFEILFQNARHFNEEGSEIYEDSVVLEKALKKKRRWLNHPLEGKQSPAKQSRTSNASMNPTNSNFFNKCQQLLFHVRNYADEHRRSLAAAFEGLPSRMDYPDYYQLIKRPIDLTYIGQRVNKYLTLEDLEGDLLLLFNNACHYNEPDSQIYKDAIVLLREMITKKNNIQHQAATEESLVPDVKELVQILLHTLYNNVMQHKDEEGRCYSDALVELLAKDEQIENNQRKPISLLIMGELLKMGFYKRIDRLQEDFFIIFKAARSQARTDSEMYEDACELQVYLLLERDRLTKEGLRFMSQSVIAITAKKVQQEMDLERSLKQEEEGEDGEEAKLPRMTIEVQPDEADLTYTKAISGVTYKVGDFVYVKSEEVNLPSNVMSVDKIWSQKDGLQGIFGSWYYRPEATYHLTSRKFMEKELFRSYHTSFVPSTGVLGKCHVMNVKDYSKFKPEGFDDKDVFVFESRYNARLKSFHKVKTYPPSAPHIVYTPREEPLLIKRVCSVFAQQNEENKQQGVAEQTKEPLVSSVEGYRHQIDEHCKTEVANPEPGCTYYEKYVTDTETYKIGDGVYVRCEEDYLLMSKIEKLWTDESGTAYFEGNWYLTPEDTKHTPTMQFYEMECFESTTQCTLPLKDVVQKCAILNLRDYQLSRPTEISEEHIYLCCAIYFEDEMKFRKKSKGFKRAQLPANVRDDELWFFDREIPPKRRPTTWLMPWGNKRIGSQDKMEDKLEGNGYLHLKKEISDEMLKSNAETRVSEILTKVDETWNSMEKEKKKEYNEKTEEIEGLKRVYYCGWDGCGYQFEDLQDLLIHVVEGNHLIKKVGSTTFDCNWQNCNKNGEGAFTMHSRFVCHVRRVHLEKPYKTILPFEKSKSYFARNQCVEDKDGTSSNVSSTLPSPLSPKPFPQHNNPLFPTPQQPNGAGSHQPSPMGQMQVQASLFPGFPRGNGTQPPPAAQVMLQQQMFHQQQIAAMQAMNQQQQPNQQPPQQQGMSADQQQMLVAQVQRQQTHIQQLQQQVSTLQRQQKEEPVFVAPSPVNMKLRHSEVYLRYIESLRDNRPYMSNCRELADRVEQPTLTAPLPTHWIKDADKLDKSAVTEALWQLRDHMLRDAVMLSSSL